MLGAWSPGVWRPVRGDGSNGLVDLGGARRRCAQGGRRAWRRVTESLGAAGPGRGLRELQGRTRPGCAPRRTARFPALEAPSAPPPAPVPAPPPAPWARPRRPRSQGHGALPSAESRPPGSALGGVGPGVRGGLRGRAAFRLGSAAGGPAAPVPE